MTDRRQVPVRQRLLAVGLLVTLALSLHSLAIEPGLAAYADLRSSLAEQRLQHAKLSALIARPHSNTDIDAAALDNILFEGMAVEDVRSNLQRWLREQAQVAGVQVQSMNSPAEPTAGAPSQVTVYATLVATLSQARDLLYAVETHRPLLIVQKADFTKHNGAAPDPQLTEPLLDVQLTLTAFYKEN